MPKSLQGLHAASATPVLPTGSTTRQGLAFTHDTCPRHITRVQRGIFYLPFPFNGHAAQHTVFMVQNTWDTTTVIWHPATPPQFTQDHPGAVQMHQWTRELAIPWLWEGMYHHHTHRPSNLQLTFGSTTKPQARELDQTGPKPSNPVPATRQVCKWPANPKKGKLGKSLCRKPSKTDIPDQLCTFTAFLGITSGIKRSKETSAEQSQSCPPSLAAPPR